jgi:hypothetical protein
MALNRLAAQFGRPVATALKIFFTSLLPASKERLLSGAVGWVLNDVVP